MGALILNFQLFIFLHVDSEGLKAFFYLTGVVRLRKDAMWWFLLLESNLSNSKKRIISRILPSAI